MIALNVEKQREMITFLQEADRAPRAARSKCG